MRIRLQTHPGRCGDWVLIWQAPDWPNWRFEWAALAAPLAELSHVQGPLMGRLAGVGLAALTDDVVKTSEIEGEHLNVESVRSSIARRLGHPPLWGVLLSGASGKVHLSFAVALRKPFARWH